MTRQGTVSNSLSRQQQQFYTNRNSQVGSNKPSGAPTKNSARGYVPQKQIVRLQSSSSTTSFHNQNQGGGPIGPRKANMKNTQCIIGSGHNSGMLSQRSESNQYNTHRGAVRKSNTIHLRSNQGQQEEENQTMRILSHKKMKSYVSVPQKASFQVPPMQLQESFDSTP